MLWEFLWTLNLFTTKKTATIGIHYNTNGLNLITAKKGGVPITVTYNYISYCTLKPEAHCTEVTVMTLLPILSSGIKYGDK